MIEILFEVVVFLIISSTLAVCVIPEPEKAYTPRERPPFNQKLWEPTQDVFEKKQLSDRWMKPPKEEKFPTAAFPMAKTPGGPAIPVRDTPISPIRNAV
ncbi:unnamed protein product [Caenorhabditis sp. 36 PRJEB53466]|nr:unnamed protein product [Caenorhabditis sp. 36 PRJEB53466]